MSKDNEERMINQNVSPGYERTITYLNNLMVTVCKFTNGPAGSPDPFHFHHHEQVTYVAEGRLIFFKGDDKFTLEKGDLITVPSDVPHCIQTLTDQVVLIDSFSPVREDFLEEVKG